MTKHYLALPHLPFQSALLPLNHRRPMLVSKFSARFSLLRKGYPKGNLRTCCFSSASDSSPSPFDISILEGYTQRVPSEVLLVHAVVNDEEDEVLIYKGHSSSLMRATSSDLEDAVLPPSAEIDGIDRMKGPYNPSNPQYIEAGLSWDEFLNFLKLRGL